MAFKQQIVNLISSRNKYIAEIGEILSDLCEEVREECGVNLSAFDNSIGGWKIYLSDMEFIITYNEVKNNGKVFGDDLRLRLENMMIDKVRIEDGSKPLYSKY